MQFGVFHYSFLLTCMCMLSMGWFAMANNMMELSLIRNNLSWPICVSLKNHQSYNFKPFAFTNISQKNQELSHSFILRMFTVTGTGQDQSRESVSQPRPPILLLNELIFPWLENLLLDFLETRQLKPPKKKMVSEPRSSHAESTPSPTWNWTGRRDLAKSNGTILTVHIVGRLQ